MPAPCQENGLQFVLPATLPIASHLLARAAVFEAGLEETIHDAPLIGDDS
jgi:hypothetical protein